MEETVRGPFIRRSPFSIDCEVKNATFGWVPFTANLRDTEPSGRAVYTYIMAQHAAEVEIVL